MSKKRVTKITSEIAQRRSIQRLEQQRKATLFAEWRYFLRNNKISYNELKTEYDKYFGKVIPLTTLSNAIRTAVCHKGLYEELETLMSYIKSELEKVDENYANQ